MHAVANIMGDAQGFSLVPVDGFPGHGKTAGLPLPDPAHDPGDHLRGDEARLWFRYGEFSVFMNDGDVGADRHAKAAASRRKFLLTTTGAKSGQKRTMPLLGIPVDGELAVIGSNFGQTPTPGWVHNLRAKPEASVQWRSATVDVTARPATADETERAFEAATKIYRDFPEYRKRASHREIQVFILEPR